MSLTRKYLKELGIDDATAEQIITEHVSVVGNIQNEILEAKETAEKVTAMQQEIDTLNDYKAQYETEKAEHEKLRAEVDSASAAKAKNDALRAYFESKGIAGDNINIAMRTVSVDGVELDGDKIKDTTALDDLIAGDLKPLVSTDSGSGSGGKRKVCSGVKFGENNHSNKENYSLGSALRETYGLD